MAFFDKGAGCGVGQTYKGGKIKQIGPDWVEVEFEGETQRLEVFGKDGKGGKGPSPSRPGMAPGMPPGGPMVRPAGPPPPSRGMPPGFQLTPEMIEQFKKMPAEIREKALQRMPAEIREKLQKAL